jgi:hypothetical protein
MKEPIRVSIRRILFATDFSCASAAALPYALALAGKHNAKIYAAHVTPERIGLPTSVCGGLQAVGAMPAREKVDGLKNLEV